jgi:PIN domain nuclease of toxin-antitoxin system
VGRFLLDTHTFLWWIQGNPSLSDRAQEILSDDSNQLYLSVASLWEVTIKLNIGKLKIPHTIDELYNLLDLFNVELIHISQLDLEQYLILPLHHRDPFDRILIAQAIERSLILVSADRSFSSYLVQQLWE